MPLRIVRPSALAVAAIALAGTAMLAAGAADSERSVHPRPFGRTAAGEDVVLYTLRNGRGVQAEITNYGGIVVALRAPDRRGQVADVALGFDRLDQYLERHPYFGAIIGRYGNRIAGGRFSIDEVEYTLARNNGDNHLHGGVRGFDKAVWQADAAPAADGRIVLRYRSRDGEEGYPGNLDTTVTYTLTEESELRIEYEATTDKPTVVNLTNHSYFNLAGHGVGDVLGHEVMIDADRFTPVDAGLIPTGELRPVEGTPFDFRTPTPIGARIDAPDEQLKFGRGYDHNFVLNGTAGQLRLVARVIEPASGRVLEVLTTEPGMQFYTGNFLDGSVRGKGGRPYPRRSGFCLETQHFPDSPNKPQFPSTLLRPGERYQTTTVYRLTTVGGSSSVPSQ
jgi:aldose 1-epimerase